MSGASHGWRNLGLWTDAPPDYPTAARALAERVGRAAGLGPDDRVFDLGCGEGASLALWRAEFEVASGLGIEPDRRAFDAARRRIEGLPGLEVRRAAAHDPLEPTSFDAGVAVDAAYHFDASRWLDAAAGALRPGGRLAFTDFVASPTRGRGGAARAAARLCGFGPGAPRTQDALRIDLERAGFEAFHVDDLTSAVLDGFARWSSGPREDGPAVSPARIRGTAALGRLVSKTEAARYVLVSARRMR